MKRRINYHRRRLSFFLIATRESHVCASFRFVAIQSSVRVDIDWLITCGAFSVYVPVNSVVYFILRSLVCGLSLFLEHFRRVQDEIRIFRVGAGVGLVGKFWSECSVAVC